MGTYDVYVRETNSDGSAQGKTQSLTFGAGTMAINFAQGATALITLTGNITSWTATGGVAGRMYALTVIQDATGSRTWSSGPSAFKWMNTAYLGGTAGSIPSLTTAASKRDSFLFYFDGTNYWQVGQVLNS